MKHTKTDNTINQIYASLILAGFKTYTKPGKTTPINPVVFMTKADWSVTFPTNTNDVELLNWEAKTKKRIPLGKDSLRLIISDIESIETSPSPNPSPKE